MAVEEQLDMITANDETDEKLPSEEVCIEDREQKIEELTVNEPDKAIINNNEQIEETADHNTKYSGWITYWDTENVYKELEVLGDNLHSVMFFAAYFNANKDLFIPEKFIDQMNTLKNTLEKDDVATYLTIVNDIELENGTSSLKDTDILNSFFEDSNTINQHVYQIIEIVEKNHFSGIEIDYEGIKNDYDLWSKYAGFLERLNEECIAKNIKLRVVLEPGLHIEKVDLPKGPTYVVMLYNLFGYHSGPGPKANESFIINSINKFDQSELCIRYALSVGGFQWTNNKVKPLTEKMVNELIETYNISPKRDLVSKSLNFEYKDQEGINHIVWYGDDITIKQWQDIIIKSGHNQIDIWRLGSNDLDTLRQLNK